MNVRKRNVSVSEDEEEHYKKRVKQTCNWYVTLDSDDTYLENSSDTESIVSIQGKDTDCAKDTSDTSSNNSVDNIDLIESEWEISEFEPVSLSESENSDVYSSSGPNDVYISNEQKTQVAEETACFSDTESMSIKEDSEMPISSSKLQAKTFTNCIQCKHLHNSGYPYCDICYKIKKSLLPPRPRRKRSATQTSQRNRTDGSTLHHSTTHDFSHQRVASIDTQNLLKNSSIDLIDAATIPEKADVSQPVAETRTETVIPDFYLAPHSYEFSKSSELLLPMKNVTSLNQGKETESRYANIENGIKSEIYKSIPLKDSKFLQNSVQNSDENSLTNLSFGGHASNKLCSARGGRNTQPNRSERNTDLTQNCFQAHFSKHSDLNILDDEKYVISNKTAVKNPEENSGMIDDPKPDDSGVQKHARESQSLQNATRTTTPPLSGPTNLQNALINHLTALQSIAFERYNDITQCINAFVATFSNATNTSGAPPSFDLQTILQSTPKETDTCAGPPHVVQSAAAAMTTDSAVLPKSYRCAVNDDDYARSDVPGASKAQKTEETDICSSSSQPKPKDSNDCCIICTVRQKDGIFVHGSKGHICTCYKCAVKIYYKNKRCPICNCKVNTVLRAYTV